MTWIFIALAAFLSGSIPFPVWLGKWALGVDVRRYGDGNPGSFNVIRAGSRGLGILALILDVSKAAVPVGIAYNNLGIRGIPMLLIAAAPVFGHAFSPFLGFKGGKAIAVSLGVWIGLTIWKASLAGVAAVIVGLALITVRGWVVMLGLAGILACLLIWLPDPILFLVWIVQAAILAWMHRADLRQKPHLRPWIIRALHASGK